MVTTNDEALHQRMSVLQAHGMRPEKRYWHEEVGYNYRMTNLQAAIGVAQLEQIDAFMAHRTKVIQRYQDNLRDIPGITLPPNQPWAHNVFWLFSVIIDESETNINRDDLAQQLSEFGVETRPLFYPLHQQPAFAPYYNADIPLKNSIWLAHKGISLPTANDISLEDVDRISDIITSIIKRARLL
jgi:perosamine synthetase